MGRTNVLSTDALLYFSAVSTFFPTIPKAFDLLRATASCWCYIGAARTVNTAIRRSQIASFQGVSFSEIPKSAACALFDDVLLPSDDSIRLRAAHQPASDALPLAAAATWPIQGSRAASSHTGPNYRPIYCSSSLDSAFCTLAMGLLNKRLASLRQRCASENLVTGQWPN